MAVALNPRPYASVGEGLPAELGDVWFDPFDRSQRLAANPRTLVTDDDTELVQLWLECVRFNPMSGMPDGYAIYLEAGGLLDQNAYYMDAFGECARAWTLLRSKKSSNGARA